MSILDVAHQAMTQKSTLERLNRFLELRGTRLCNEAWFEWEVYYWLLKEDDYGWKRDKRNRRGEKRRRGDGVDLQFKSDNFIEIKVAFGDHATPSWLTSWIRGHSDADACLFLAMRNESINRWLQESVFDGEFTYLEKKAGSEWHCEIETRQINKNWFVGIMKCVESRK
jgi:hypothetical protein